MSLFSLNWFKTNKEIEKAKLEQILIQNQILLKQLGMEKLPEKPYLKLKLVNNVLTVVFKDGSLMSKVGADEDTFLKVKNCITQEQILSIFKNDNKSLEQVKDIKENKSQTIFKSGLDDLNKLSIFTFSENCLYLKGINRTIPDILAKQFLNVYNRIKDSGVKDIESNIIKDDEFISLRNFFMWCCLNPRAEVADELYAFLKKNSFRITKQGFFVALRNVVTLNPGENDEVHFISNAYQKVKAVWKKSPKNYLVIKDAGNNLVLVKSTEGLSDFVEVGNLYDLYLDLPNMKENRFTDDWTKTFDIRVGKVVNMPKEDCNWSTQDCAAAGLHFTANEIHYVGCGDTSVLILINPMKVVGIGQHKGRCYEYLPIMTVPRDEATSILHDLDFDTLELDEDYAIDELASLKEKVKEGFSVEAKKHQFNLPQLSSKEMNNIILSLDMMKKTLTKRVSSIK